MAEPLTDEATLSLWGGTAPGAPDGLEQVVVERSKSLYRADRALMGITDPSLTVFRPEHPNGTSMIVAPGGSYRRVVLDKEGIEIARAMAERGITSFLLSYRLPGEGHENATEAPLADAQRAVRMVRGHAQDWGLDPAKVGFLGFSAAGHLGGSIATMYDRETYDRDDADAGVSARPDFVALIYPVMTMEDGPVHAGSREALLGAAPTAEQIAAWSPEQHVTAETPQTFLLHADDDPSVDSENAIRFYMALHEAGVPAELHVFRDGGHGFGIRGAGDRPVAGWPDLLAGWLDATGMTDGAQ
ncbi:alpha/beta hydrolase [Mangrovicoccus sp. HB182678]|uniref:Alpha/beta hydrolase n=2 Tax=Mangrovicoccus algicola TaxID=2771008 RepID=A0A8J6YXB0_9RHOB|nr:alpha/beta hydrolase [Mangrovicoccus algicola]